MHDPFRCRYFGGLRVIVEGRDVDYEEISRILCSKANERVLGASPMEN